jgi:predicted DNA-binding protein (MmcQ/YjbR family)
MDYQQARTYILNHPAASEDFPFGPETAVYRVHHKIFALLTLEQGEARVSLKCDPSEALALRDLFKAVTPGYHLNKKHWNTVILDGTVPIGEIRRMIDNSYALVIAGLPHKQKP